MQPGPGTDADAQRGAHDDVRGALAEPVSDPEPHADPDDAAVLPRRPADGGPGGGGRDPRLAGVLAGLEKFAADPLGFTDFTETQYVTTGSHSTEVLDALDSLRDSRMRSEGGMVFRDVVVGPEKMLGDEVSREVTYCMDTRQLRVFMIDTGERFPRADTYRQTSTMVKGPDGKWRVGLIRNKKAEC